MCTSVQETVSETFPEVNTIPLGIKHWQVVAKIMAPNKSQLEKSPEFTLFDVCKLNVCFFCLNLHLSFHARRIVRIQICQTKTRKGKRGNATKVEARRGAHKGSDPKVKHPKVKHPGLWPTPKRQNHQSSEPQQGKLIIMKNLNFKSTVSPEGHQMLEGPCSVP